MSQGAAVDVSTAPPRPPTRAATTRDGFAVIWVAIKREPWIFALSTLGSLLFGALTVADAWVLGWSTHNVVLPAFETGEVDTSMLWAILALFVGVAILRAVGIVARRLGAGIMQYRMQAHSRRAVTRQYLSLPMEWHQRHPTGELLSNANSDVEAAWGPIAPLPMAVGTVAMMVIAIVQMFLADAVMALVGLLVFPAVVLANLAYQRLASPLMTRAQELRAEVSEIAHESFDGAMVVKTLGREGEETARFAAKARELRDVNIRAGAIRAAFDPTLAALPNLGVLVVLAVGVDRVLNGHADPGDVVTIAYLLTIVSLPDPLDRLAARGVPAQRRRLRPGVPGARGDRPDGLRRRGARRTRRPRRATAVENLGYDYDAGQDLLRTSRSTSQPGRTVAVVGATASGKSTLTSLLTRLVDPDRGRILSTASTCATWPRRALGRRRRRARSRRSSSTTTCGATSPSAPTSPTRTSGPRCGPPRLTASSPPSRTGSTAGWGSAAPRSRAVSASGSRWPAPWFAARVC